MEVKDVIISALNLLGRRDTAQSVASGQTPDGEEGELVNALLYCFNAVEDELARKYFPLAAKDDLTSYTGTFVYTKFAHSPVKIRRVLSGGAEVEYEVYAQYIAVNEKNITVEYEYAPAKKKLSDASDFGAEVSENLMAFGIAAEYCLINGEIEAAELWEKKYRMNIDVAQNALPSGGTIPPRRWV